MRAEPPPAPSVPVALVPRLEDGARVGFFAYGDGGDADTGVLAGVRVAVIEDPEGWWRALRDDAPEGMEGLPPGYQVSIPAGRLREAPARVVTTGSDGIAVADWESGRDYLYCAFLPGVDDVIAGCSDIRGFDNHGNYYSVYFSAGSAYFVSYGDDQRDGSSHYGNFLLRQNWQSEPLTVTFAYAVAVDFEDEDIPEGVYFRDGVTFAVVADSDIGRWWSEISQRAERALSVLYNEDLWEHAYAAAAWSDAHLGADSGLEWRQRVRRMDITGEGLASARAQYVTTGSDGTAGISLVAGNHLMCLVQFDIADSPGAVRIHDCIYEDVTGDNTVVVYESSVYGSRFEERSHAEGVRVLRQVERLFAQQE